MTLSTTVKDAHTTLLDEANETAASIKQLCKKLESRFSDVLKFEAVDVSVLTKDMLALRNKLAALDILLGGLTNRSLNVTPPVLNVKVGGIGALDLVAQGTANDEEVNRLVQTLTSGNEFLRSFAEELEEVIDDLISAEVTDAAIASTTDLVTTQSSGMPTMVVIDSFLVAGGVKVIVKVRDYEGQEPAECREIMVRTSELQARLKEELMDLDAEKAADPVGLVATLRDASADAYKVLSTKYSTEIESWKASLINSFKSDVKRLIFGQP